MGDEGESERESEGGVRRKLVKVGVRELEVRRVVELVQEEEVGWEKV